MLPLSHIGKHLSAVELRADTYNKLALFQVGCNVMIALFF